ncbi:MAG: hypothetical protein VX589_15850 [Myxococcota bacterium]|nr:hypothetical protein [Myxococcota bacterium]
MAWTTAARRMLLTMATLGVASCSAHADAGGSPSIQTTTPSPRQTGPSWILDEAKRASKIRTILSTYRPRQRRLPAQPDAECRATMDALANNIGGEPVWMKSLLESDQPRARILAMVLSGLHPAAGRTYAPEIAAQVVNSVNRLIEACQVRTTDRMKEAKQQRDSRRQCRHELSGGPAPATVQHGCRILTKVGSQTERLALLDIGINGYFSRACVAFFLGGDLVHDAVRRFIRADIDLAPVGGLVREHLVRAGRSAIEAGIVDLERDQRPSADAEQERCLLGTIVSEILEGDEGRAILPPLDEAQQRRLRRLMTGRQAHVMDCARTVMNRVKASKPLAVSTTKPPSTHVGPPTVTKSYGPFCRSPSRAQ